MLFIKSKVQIGTKAERIHYPGIFRIYSETASPSVNRLLAKLVIEVADMVDFAESHSNDFVYFDEKTLSFYFRNSSDMNLFILNYKILT